MRTGWLRAGRLGRSLRRTNPLLRGTGCAVRGGHSVSGGGEEGEEGERARLAFGSDKNATASLSLSIVATRFALRPAHIFLRFRPVFFAHRHVAFGSTQSTPCLKGAFSPSLQICSLPDHNMHALSVTIRPGLLLWSVISPQTPIPCLPPVAGRRRYADVATKFARTKPHMNIGTIGNPSSPPP